MLGIRPCAFCTLSACFIPGIPSLKSNAWPLPLKTSQMSVIPWVLGPICLHAPLSLSLGVQDHTVPYPTLFLPPTPTLEIQPSDGCLQRAHQHLTLASQTLLLFHCPNLVSAFSITCVRNQKSILPVPYIRQHHPHLQNGKQLLPSLHVTTLILTIAVVQTAVSS